MRTGELVPTILSSYPTALTSPAVPTEFPNPLLVALRRSVRGDRRVRVDAIHEDESYNKTAAAAVGLELNDLARWLEVDLVLPD